MLIKKLMIATSFVSILLAGGVQAGGDAANGKALAEEHDCAGCHEDNGLGDPDEDIPAAAGVSEADAMKAWKEYIAGTRDKADDDMAEFAKTLSEQDLADMSAYYSTLPGK